jgi:hypothetical protein
MLAAEQEAKNAAYRNFRYRMIFAAVGVLVIVAVSSWQSCGR